MKSKQMIPKLLVGLFLTTILFSSFTWGLENKEEWTFLKEEANVKAFVKTDDCNGSSVFIFKFENVSKENLDVEVSMELTDDPSIIPIKNSISIKSKETVKGNCELLWKLALPNEMESSKDLKERIRIQINQK